MYISSVSLTVLSIKLLNTSINSHVSIKSHLKKNCSGTIMFQCACKAKFPRELLLVKWVSNFTKALVPPGLCIKTRLSAQPLIWINDFSFSCKQNSFPQERLSTWPHFESEGFRNSEMAQTGTRIFQSVRCPFHWMRITHALGMRLWSCTTENSFGLENDQRGLASLAGAWK